VVDKIYISNIQRFSVHDGPGIRTTVFFLGCPLRCSWCQNPETFKKTPELMLNDALCTGCGACIEACPVNAIEFKDGKIVTDRTKCTRCGNCVDVCYFEARELSGVLYSVEEVYAEIMKDAVVYKNTGGGVTLSGGEPLLYPDFAYEVLSCVKEKGYGTAIETCGQVSWDNIEKVLPVTDLLLFDVKMADSGKHREWIGFDNDLIRENLKKAAESGVRIIPRIPLIPGVNDSAAEFSAILDICEALKGVDEIHIMPFHQIGSSKYEMLDYKYRLKEKKEGNANQVGFCVSLAEKRKFRVSVGGSGIKTKEEELSENDDGWFLYRK
jgi:pyruvate formate lyase activating enzyme